MVKHTEKTIAVVHSDGAVRVTLKSLLKAHGCSVTTLPTCQELLEDSSLPRPHLILLDRSLLPEEGLPVLSQLNRKWNDETHIVFLPEDLGHTPEASKTLSQLLGIIDRFLRMRTTNDLLAV